MSKIFPRIKRVVTFFIALLTCAYWLQSSLHFLPLTSSSPFRVASANESATVVKTILLYNSPHPLITQYFGSHGSNPFLKHNCAVSACVLYQNESTTFPLDRFDAVLIHVFALRQAKPNVWPHSRYNYKRSHHQRYIFFTQEPPTLLKNFSGSLSSYNNYFNWTMTYKRNSDVPLLYGYVERIAQVTFDERTNLTKTPEPASLQILKSKQKLVAWFVSDLNTPGKREEYARELEKYINIDIYGKGRKLTCPRIKGFSISDSKCYDMLERTYKFYLSFENSLCEDYVTEKLFLVFQRLIVPVVYGKADYASFLPEHSYINALDYSPRQLAEYLTYLDSNRTAYEEYFWWKPYFKVHAGWEEMSPRAMCNLCAKLHEEPQTTQICDSLADYYGNQTNCVTP